MKRKESHRSIRRLFLVFGGLCLSISLVGCDQEAAKLNGEGLDFLNKGKATEAIEKFKQASDIKPKEFPILYNLAVAYQQAGKPAEAIKALQQCTQNSPEPEKYEQVMALLQMESGDYAAAANGLRLLVKKDPKDAQNQLYLGVALLKQNAKDEAVAAFDEALAVDAYNCKAFLAKSAALRDTEPDKALEVLNQAAQISQDAGTPEDKGMIHWNLGTLLLRMNLADKAVQELEKAHELMPDDKDCITTLAMVYQNLGQFDKAYQIFTLLPPEIQASPDSHMFLARVHYNKTNYTMALSEARKVLSSDSNNVNAVNLQGMIYARRNQMILAIRQFERSMEIQPDQPEIKQILGALKRVP